MKRSRLRAGLTYVVLTIATVVWGFPMVWIAISSFKPSADLTARGFNLIFVPTIEHYRFIFERQPFLYYVRNSVVVTGISTLIAVVIGSLAAYSISRFKTGGDGLSFWVLSTRMAPPAVLIIPYFLIFQALGMFNTWWALGCAYVEPGIKDTTRRGQRLCDRLRGELGRAVCLGSDDRHPYRDIYLHRTETHRARSHIGGSSLRTANLLPLRDKSEQLAAYTMLGDRNLDIDTIHGCHTCCIRR